MRILVLGGTRFVGRHLVEAALAKGHEVTLFNRGKRDPEAFPQVEHLVGDRDGDLSALEGRSWDAVVDVAAYFPSQVVSAVQVLRGSVEQYAFVSTISVYPDEAGGNDEDAPVYPPDRDSTENKPETYGARKVACEEEVRAAFPDRHLIARPGVIVGPHDYINRFPYWVNRIAAGGEVLAPGDPEQPVQIIDARDLGEFIVHGLENGVRGTCNAVGPEYTLRMGEMLERIRAALGSDARFTWASEELLLAHEVAPFEEMPLWVPAESQAMLTLSNRRAVDAGMTFRSVEETARDCRAYELTRPADAEARRSGMTAEREAEILAAVHGVPVTRLEAAEVEDAG